MRSLSMHVIAANYQFSDSTRTLAIAFIVFCVPCATQHFDVSSKINLHECVTLKRLKCVGELVSIAAAAQQTQSLHT